MLLFKFFNYYPKYLCNILLKGCESFTPFIQKYLLSPYNVPGSRH